MFSDDAYDSNPKTGLMSGLSNRQSKHLVSFDSISPSTTTPLADLKYWPRAIVCPACQASSITRVERKVCGGTQYVSLVCLCTSINYYLAPWLACCFYVRLLVDQFLTCQRCSRTRSIIAVGVIRDWALFISRRVWSFIYIDYYYLSPIKVYSVN